MPGKTSKKSTAAATKPAPEKNGAASKPAPLSHDALSCSECSIRNCFRRTATYPGFCLTEKHAADAIATKELYTSDGVDAKIARAAAEVEGEYYGRLTRLEETVRFGQKIGAKKIGIASCVGLLNEASIYAKILRTAGFEVRTAICKIGGIDKLELGLPEELKVCPGCNESFCNPVLQAKALDDWGSDLNVVFGLCVGHDALFSRYSRAPAVVFMVKDRVLAHNPTAAIYASHFYYKRVLDEKTFPKPHDWDKANYARDTRITAADRERDEKLRYLALAERFGSPDDVRKELGLGKPAKKAAAAKKATGKKKTAATSAKTSRKTAK